MDLAKLNLPPIITVDLSQVLINPKKSLATKLNIHLFVFLQIAKLNVPPLI